MGEAMGEAMGEGVQWCGGWVPPVRAPVWCSVVQCCSVYGSVDALALLV